MNVDFIRAGLNGELPWFTPGEYTEEDFRKGIKHSVDIIKDSSRCMQPVEELAELIQAVIKVDRKPGDEDSILHLYEEVGDALWAIGCIVEKYNLSEETIKNIRKLKDEYEFIPK